MTAATTIIFAREDLSIPGAADDAAPILKTADAVQARFFELVDRGNPDVIVLDFGARPPAGSGIISKVRQRTDTPILIVCNPDDPLLDEYRVAGAAECVPAPVDIIGLNQSIQKVMRIRGRAAPAVSRAPADVHFAEMRFCPGRNLLAGSDGSTVELTSSEARLLAHLVSKPWILCTRKEIGELLYGPEHMVGDRATDVVVNRLRRKLAVLGGPDAEQLIKTEFKRGYLLVADVTNLPHQPATRPRAVLHSAG
jgi:DNA-binding response OmpR family regulator